MPTAAMLSPIPLFGSSRAAATGSNLAAVAVAIAPPWAFLWHHPFPQASGHKLIFKRSAHTSRSASNTFHVEKGSYTQPITQPNHTFQQNLIFSKRCSKTREKEELLPHVHAIFLRRILPGGTATVYKNEEEKSEGD